MTSAQAGRKPHKLCFVTVGATAPFTALSRAVLRPKFLNALAKKNYTHLYIQHGSDDGRALLKNAFPEIEPTVVKSAKPGEGSRHATQGEADDLTSEDDKFKALKIDTQQGVRVCAYAFRKNLTADMMAVRAANGLFLNEQEGCLICHAGTGTVLEAMNQSIATIVVPNTALLDNHQADLSAELARQGYVVNCHLVSGSARFSSDQNADADAHMLAYALTDVEDLRARLRSNPPVNYRRQANEPKYSTQVAEIMSEEIGYTHLD